MAAFAEGRHAVITGGAGGIGLAAARACLARGLRVTLGDVDGPRLGEAARELAAEAPGRVAELACDVREPSQVEALREAAVTAHGPVHLLLLNAGLGRPTTSWTERAAWEETLGVNLWGVINGLMAFVPGCWRWARAARW
jgi:NAD(P)-dependent dehydrogenase (short-subunit alcohol dehydrogenase family)